MITGAIVFYYGWRIYKWWTKPVKKPHEGFEFLKVPDCE